MTNRRILALALALLCAAGGPAWAQDAADEFQKIGLKQILGAGWTDFERTFAALSADPHNDQAFQEMSGVVLDAGALNKVSPYLEMLAAQRPGDGALHIILGRVYKDLLRDPVRARAHFEAVLQQDPDDFYAHYQLGALLARQGDKNFTPAVAHYRSAAEKVTRQDAGLRTRILKELGELLYTRREQNAQYEAEAFTAWDAMTQGVRRFDLQTYEELSAEYRAQGRWRKVQETYERYFDVLREIHDAPDNVTRCRLKTSIAEACENQELYEKACAAYLDAIALLDENTWQRRTLEARVLACRTKLHQAPAYEQELKQAVTADPNRLAPRLTLSRMLALCGRPDDAAACLEAARQLAPRNVPVLNALESLYRQSGRDEALAGILRARIDLAPEDFNAYVELAGAHMRAGHTELAEKVLAQLEATPSQLPEKFLLLARAYTRYGLPKRAFVLYQRLAAAGEMTSEDRVEFCGFCLSHGEFAQEAALQAGQLCDTGTLSAAGFVRLAEVFRAHQKNDLALGLLLRGVRACAQQPDGKENREAVFTLNLALSDLEHRLGAGHHAQAIASTLKALLAAPDLHFKRTLNDRLMTLLTHYGHREKLLYSAEDEAREARAFGGPHGQGLAPWIDFLNTQANSREDPDLWMLLGQLNETVDVDAEIPAPPAGPRAPPAFKRIKTDLAQARLCYQKVVDMEYQNLDAHQALARVLADPLVDEYERAINELEVLSLLNPVAKWETWQAIGDTYASAGETAQAREKWRAVAEQSASEPDLLAQISMRLFRAGDLTGALELSEQASTLSPYVFSYRFANTNLLARAAAKDSGGGVLDRLIQQAAQALHLAQASEPLSPFIPEVTAALRDARTGLAHACFERGEFQAAKEQYEALSSLLTAANQRPPADLDIQIARCLEALGNRPAALQRYEEILKDQPRVSCWLATGVTVSGASFLALKREGPPASRAGPLAPTPPPPVHVRLIRDFELHDAPRAAAALGTTFCIEGARQRHLIEPATGKLLSSTDQPEVLYPARTRLLTASPGLAILLHGNEVRAFQADTGVVLWKKLPSDLERLGQLQTVKAVGAVVVIGGIQGVQVLKAATGELLWERLERGLHYDANERLLALIAPTESSDAARGKEWQTLDLVSGQTVASGPLAGTVLWNPPLLAGERVLLTDSLSGTVFGFDARTGQAQFTVALDTAAILPPVVAGGVACFRGMSNGMPHALAFDLKQLRLRFDVPLQAAHSSHGDPAALPPLPWKDRLLYLDTHAGAVLVLHLGTGTLETVIPADTGAGAAMSPGATLDWVLFGDTLCVVDLEGRVRLWELTVEKRP